MGQEMILSILISLILVNFLIDLILDRVNLRHSKRPFPDELSSLFSAEDREKSRAYLQERTNFSNLLSIISTAVFLVLIISGFFGYWDRLLQEFGFEGIWRSLVFIGSLGILSDLIQTPVQWYSVFVIEEKYGFNSSSQKTFFTDKIKGYALALIIGLPILYTLFFLIQNLDQGFWLPFWIVITIFMIFMQFFYTTLIVPLFNKLSPVSDEGLLQRIAELSKKVSFPITNVLMIDGSKRSRKANAFFSGFGKKKKVVLYDTLMEQLNSQEIEAVFAHEIGHYKKKHIYQGMIFSILQTGLTLYLFSLLLFSADLSNALGATEWVVHINLIAIGILISPLGSLLGYLGNLISRKNEYQADGFARQFGYGEDLISALQKLTVKNLSNPNPHPFYVAWNYSHPTLVQRIRSIRSRN